MSTFEIVKGVEGDCLVLDNTRICGPKPWGGGYIIKTFHTDGIYEVIERDEYHKLMDENTKLRERVAELEELTDEKRYIPQEWYTWLKDENAKLRKQLDYMTPIAWYAASKRERDRMRELGVEEANDFS